MNVYARDTSRAAVRLLVASTVLAPALSGCTASDEPASPGGGRTATAPATTASPTPYRREPSVTLRARPTPSAAQRVVQRLTLRQQVGQLLMVGVPAQGTSSGVLQELGRSHVGNVFLRGRSGRGVRATAAVTRGAQQAMEGPATGGVPLLVATDQEGGIVQTLTGPGFARIPSAQVQSRWSPGRLRAQARRWARQLRAAGVNLDLAPVGDVVPRSPDPRTNGPIGRFDRHLGNRAGEVRPRASAFVRGMTSAGVATAVKHFPGLGHVRGNTDTAVSVDDVEVGPRDPGLQVFPDVARTGTAMVMTATAVYRKIDPTRPASFSSPVVQRLLRGRLGFRGVVVSDDLGAALQVQRWRPGRRATMFVAAGGDLALTVRSGDAAPMAGALVGAARRDPAMRQRVEQSALRVLTFKQRLGLLRR
jgi:beta-N-acetylhexosaminidase